ncbi:hypothetical protein E4U32_007951 [Claviceps aff. humidiphila group G2b]|nr:hypothetical protein E4U32_007951 [Claviceps aff. humidiphila group G2b]
MKFLSLIYVFGAMVSPIIAHTDPNVKGAVDAIDQDMSGAPTEMLARRPMPPRVSGPDSEGTGKEGGSRSLHQTAFATPGNHINFTFLLVG